MYKKEDVQEFIKIVFEIIDNNKNESKKAQADLIKKEVERKVRRWFCKDWSWVISDNLKKETP